MPQVTNIYLPNFILQYVIDAVLLVLPNPVRCKFCSKTFSKNSNLNIHMRAEHDKQRYECPICQKLFKSSYALKKHVNNPLIHGKKANITRQFNTMSTKVITSKDGHYELLDCAKNQLIKQLKLEIVALETEKKSYISTIGKYKTQIDSLRAKK